jgi:hypothetical protein
MAQQSYCKTKEKIHIKAASDLDDALESIRENLQWYIGDYDTSLFKQLKGTECSSGFMKLIEELVKGTVTIKAIKDAGYLDLVKITDAIALDQRHDFEDSRCNLSECVDFSKTPLSSISEKIKEIIADDNSGVKPLKGNNELLPEKYSVDMGPQSVYAKNIKHSIDKISYSTDNNCGKINTVSQIIDAAGCDTNCKKDLLSNAIDIDIQFYIYNIGFILYQGFFEFFKNTHSADGKNYKYIVLYGRGQIDPQIKRRQLGTKTSDKIPCIQPTNPKANDLTDLKQKVYLFVYENDLSIKSVSGNPKPIAIQNVNVGSTGFSVEKICRFIKTQQGIFGESFITAMERAFDKYKNPLEVTRQFFITLPMSAKGYGDSGQMITTIFMSCSNTLCEGKYANKIILMTCDTFFMQLLYLFKCPFLLGTRSTPCYLYDESSKLRGKLAVNIYNETYGTVKIVLNGNPMVKSYNIPSIQKTPTNRVNLPSASMKDISRKIGRGLSYNIAIMERFKDVLRSSNKYSTEYIQSLYHIVPYSNITNDSIACCLVEKGFNIVTQKATHFFYPVNGVKIQEVYNGTCDEINIAKDKFDLTLSGISGLTKLFAFASTIVFKKELYSKQSNYLFDLQYSYFSKQFEESLGLKAKGKFISFKDTIMMSPITNPATLIAWNKSSLNSHQLTGALRDLNDYLNISFETQVWSKKQKECNNPSKLVKKSLEECDEMLDYYETELELVKEHLNTIFTILEQDSQSSSENKLNAFTILHLCTYALVLFEHKDNIYKLSHMYSGKFLKHIEAVTGFTQDKNISSFFEGLKEIGEGKPGSQYNYPLLKEYFNKKYNKATAGLLEDPTKQSGVSINMCIDNYLQFAKCFDMMKNKVYNHRVLMLDLSVKINELESSSTVFTSNKVAVRNNINSITYILTSFNKYTEKRNTMLYDVAKGVVEMIRKRSVDKVKELENELEKEQHKEELLESLGDVMESQGEDMESLGDDLVSSPKKQQYIENIKDMADIISEELFSQNDDEACISYDDCMDNSETMVVTSNKKRKREKEKEDSNGSKGSNGSNGSKGSKDREAVSDYDPIYFTPSKATRLSGGKPKTYRKTDIKKNILGKERIIYKISGSKKEYIKYKGDYIYVKEYIKSRAASNQRSKPGSKKASKASSAALPSKDLSAPLPKPKAPTPKPTPTKPNASKEPSRKPSKKH